MALNDYAMGGLNEWVYLSREEWAQNQTKTIEKEIYAQAGDKIYFLLSKNGGSEGTYKATSDTVLLDTTVTYEEFNDVSDEQHTTGDQSLILPVAGKTYSSHTTIAEHPKGNFSYVRIDKNTNTLHPLVYDNGQLRVTKATESLDYYGYFGSNYSGGTAANCDIAVVYTAPIKMNVDVLAHGQFTKAQSDGGNVYFYKNNFNFKLGEGFFEPAGELIYHTVENITLDKGDKVFIVLNNNGTNSYDGGAFAAQIKCNSINPDSEVTTPESPSHKGNIAGDKIFLEATTVGDLIDSFTDESFVNVKAEGEYLTRYATIKTGDTVVIDGNNYTAVVSGDGNANGKVDRDADDGDIKLLRDKLVGNELTGLGTLAFEDDTDVTGLVRRMKEVSQYADMSYAPVTLQTTEAFELASETNITDAFVVNRTSNEFGTVRIRLNNESDTNYGILHYKAADSESYNKVPFYFEEGEQTVSVSLTTTTSFAGTIESIYLSVPSITEGTISGIIKVMSESRYHEMSNREETHMVMFTDVESRSIKVVDLDKVQPGVETVLTDEDIIWESATIDGGVDDAKLRYSQFYKKMVVLVSSSSGYVGIIDYETRKPLWQTNLTTNFEKTMSPHSIEMLPEGDIVVACSGHDNVYSTEWNGEIIYYKVSQTGYKNTSRIGLKSAHGVLWDPTENVIWVLGMDGLVAYTVDSQGVLSQVADKGFEMALCDGHALAMDYEDSNYLWIGTAVDQVIKFDKTRNEVVMHYKYSEMPIDNSGRVFANAVNVKGIASFADGTVIYNKADGTGYTTDKICIIDSTGQRIYQFKDTTIYKVTKFEFAYYTE